MTEYDFVVIGGGNTGLSAAYRVAGAGKRVALADRGPIGGLCSLAGCNPKKVFVRATEVLDEVRRAAEHGISAGPVSIDWSQVWRRKKTFTDPVPRETEESLRKRGIDVLRGSARFTSPGSIDVAGEEVRASGFAIATGSHPRVLGFPGAHLVKTTDDLLDLREPPGRLVIVGAGVVAFEFAHVFARLGSRVTVLLRGNRALAEFDADFIEPVVDFTRALGVEFRDETNVERVTESGGSLRVEIERRGAREPISADFVLNAAGRVAALESLDLELAGAKGSERGLVVDEFLRSPGNRRVFGGGDAHGRFQLSPVASYEGRVIARNFLEGDVERADYRVIPRAVFTVPPLAAVGLTEEEAREAGVKVDVAVNDMTGWKVFRIAGASVARVKVVAEPDSGRIAGAQLFCSGADELVPIFAIAIRCGLTVSEFRNMVFPYPTFASALEAALPKG